MMALEETGEPPMLSNALVALAYTVLRNKPNTLSIRGLPLPPAAIEERHLTFADYIAILRDTLSPPEDSHCKSKEYLDGVSYWKTLFQQSQYEIFQIQGKFGALEKENEALRQEVALNKRKADGEAGGPRKVTRTKAKRTDAFDLELTTVDFPELESLNGNQVLFHLSAASKLCSSADNRDEEISYHVIEITIALSTHLDNLEETVLDSEDAIGNAIDLVSHFRAISRSFGLALQCLSRIARTSTHHQNLVGAVVFKCTKLFHQILERITQLSVKCYLRTPDAKKSKTKHQKSLERFLHLTVRLFLEFIPFLNSSCPAHFEVFEGVLFLVLERCGKLLYTLTFGHNNPHDIIREIEMDQETFINDASPSVDMRRAAAESKYVFMLLKRLMAVAPSFYREPGNKSASRIPSKAVKRPYTKLSLHAREKLQETLIKCIWEDENETDPLLARDSLQRPSFIGMLPQVPEEADDVNKKQDWFVDELWKLVGWGILGRKTTWEEV